MKTPQRHEHQGKWQLTVATLSHTPRKMLVANSMHPNVENRQVCQAVVDSAFVNEAEKLALSNAKRVSGPNTGQNSGALFVLRHLEDGKILTLSNSGEWQSVDGRWWKVDQNDQFTSIESIDEYVPERLSKLAISVACK
ncbi:hypothetical protein [uncultured Aliiroseovarius sp.]|uniref:hypothetical protein n=1 Tax=uncultured Aliiroseovarius sp. TaxID=1658783 RepID=UPI00261A1758|nr:hypothetical protein [uncultured Aliiroseovarius sp.]